MIRIKKFTSNFILSFFFTLIFILNTKNGKAPRVEMWRRRGRRTRGGHRGEHDETQLDSVERARMSMRWWCDCAGTNKCLPEPDAAPYSSVQRTCEAEEDFLPQVECHISCWWWRNRIISTTVLGAKAAGAAVTSGKTMEHKDEENTEFLIRNSSEPEKREKNSRKMGKNI